MLVKVLASLAENAESTESRPVGVPSSNTAVSLSVLSAGDKDYFTKIL